MIWGEMVLQHAGEGENYAANVFSVRKFTKNLSKIAKELGEVGARCNEFTTMKSKLLEGVRDEKMHLQRLEARLLHQLRYIQTITITITPSYIYHSKL